MTETWLQLSLTAGRYSPEQLEQALLASGALAVTLAQADSADAPVLEPLPGQTPLWPRTRVTGLFDQHSDPGLTRQRLLVQLDTDSLADCDLDLSELADRDWIRAWLDDYKPMRFGQRLRVLPSHLAPDLADDSDARAVNIVLDPGLAFGTGTHPTTALCLEWLDTAGACRINDLKVIDYGCGSGILAIAAARLGAARVWAVDIDPQALWACRANAERNNVAERIAVSAPDTLPLTLDHLELSSGVDLLLANILAAPLIELAHRFDALVSPTGSVVLSGILNQQAAAVRAAFEPYFAVCTEHRQRQDWTLLALTRD